MIITFTDENYSNSGHDPINNQFEFDCNDNDYSDSLDPYDYIDSYSTQQSNHVERDLDATTDTKFPKNPKFHSNPKCVKLHLNQPIFKKCVHFIQCGVLTNYPVCMKGYKYT